MAELVYARKGFDYVGYAIEVLERHLEDAARVHDGHAAAPNWREGDGFDTAMNCPECGQQLTDAWLSLDLVRGVLGRDPI